MRHVLTLFAVVAATTGAGCCGMCSSCGTGPATYATPAAAPAYAAPPTTTIVPGAAAAPPAAAPVPYAGS